MLKAPGTLIHGKDLGARAAGHVVIDGQRNLAADDDDSFEGKRKAKQQWQRMLVAIAGCYQEPPPPPVGIARPAGEFQNPVATKFIASACRPH
jgi:hypothetical protein